MINLVPPSAKKQIVIEYWLRVLTVWLTLLSIVALVGVALMFPVYVLVKSQVDVYRASAETAQAKIAVYENVSSDLVQASQQARLILESRKNGSLSSYVYLFGSLETSDLSITSITVNRGTTGIDPVTLSGVAADRQALADFRDRLLALEEVETVDFPISNLAKDRDIPFNMMVTLSNKPAS